ncbi:MAG: tetratricopeptide repeat protein [Anaerolineae bacterium]|nr:tetratricopeptide repeat protein [Anaerolineae bacterium]
MRFGQVSEEHIKIAELSRRIGQILVERGDYEQAMHQFQLGLQYLAGIEHNEVARIYNEIGRVYWHQGRLREAQEWTEKAFDLGERLLDPDEVARFLYFAGTRYRRQGANDLAERHWFHSLEICEETGDLAMQGRLYQNLGWLSAEVGNYRQALERLEKGRHLSELCGDISNLSVLHETLGEADYALGEWDRAIEHLQQSLNLGEQAGLRKAKSRVFCLLGDIYRNQGRWTEADECYQRALSGITTAGVSQTVAVVNVSLGEMNMDRKRYDQAQEFFDKAWTITSEGVGFAKRMAKVKALMGELAVHTGKLDEAEAHTNEAVRLAKEADGRLELATATMINGTIAAKKDKWEQALEYFGNAKDMFEEMEVKHQLGRVHLGLGTLYQNRNGGEQDRDDAKMHFDQAWTIFSELGARPDLEKLPER